MLGDEYEGRSFRALKIAISLVAVLLFSILFYFIMGPSIGQFAFFIFDLLIIVTFINGILAKTEQERGPTSHIKATVLYIFVVVFWAVFNSQGPGGPIDAINLLVFLVMFSPLYLMVYLIISYKGEGSRLIGLKPLADRFPAIKRPEGHVHFRTKMIWTLGILIIYYAMTNVILFGLDPARASICSQNTGPSSQVRPVRSCTWV